MLAVGVSCGLHRIERLMRLQALKARPTRPQLRGARSQPQMDCRLHVCVDGRGLALCGCGRRSVLAACGRLVDERCDDGPTRDRRAGDGDLATRQARCAAASLRSRQPVRQRAVPEANVGSWCRLLDEPLRQRLGQCADGELLLLAEDRAHSAQDLSYARLSQGRRVRLH
jgi:hypothetical protein